MYSCCYVIYTSWLYSCNHETSLLKVFTIHWLLCFVSVHIFFTWQAKNKKLTSMKKPCAQKLKLLKTWLFDVNTATYDVITYQSQGSYDNKFSYKKTLIYLKTRSVSFPLNTKKLFL